MQPLSLMTCISSTPDAKLHHSSHEDVSRHQESANDPQDCTEDAVQVDSLLYEPFRYAESFKMLREITHGNARASTLADPREGSVDHRTFISITRRADIFRGWPLSILGFLLQLENSRKCISAVMERLIASHTPKLCKQ